MLDFGVKLFLFVDCGLFKSIDLLLEFVALELDHLVSDLFLPYYCVDVVNSEVQKGVLSIDHVLVVNRFEDPPQLLPDVKEFFLHFVLVIYVGSDGHEVILSVLDSIRGIARTQALSYDSVKGLILRPFI